MLFQVWFKNRRAKLRQHETQKTIKNEIKKKAKNPSRPPVVTDTSIPIPSTSTSPEVKQESPQPNQNVYRSNGNITPQGSNTTSSIATTPSPPIPSGSNPTFIYQHDSYNSFANWHASNGHNGSPHHYYGQNYNPAYYSQVDYFNQQSAQNQVQMNSMSGSYQMSSYHSAPGPSGTQQNYSPSNIDYSNPML